MAPNHSIIDDQITEEVVKVNNNISVFHYIVEFFAHLERVTGLKKEAFTRAGMQSYLKNISKQFYQMDIRDKLLTTIFELVKLFTCVINKDTLEAGISLFVNILYNITNFLFIFYVGKATLFITTGLSTPMTAFVFGIFHITIFIFDHLSVDCFYKLKNWIMCFFRSEKINEFFEHIFGTYGRAIAAV